MQSLVTGVTTTISLKFRPPLPTFSVAPQWELVSSNDVVISAGTATPSSEAGAWLLNVIVPEGYSTASGSEELTIELYGTDTRGKIRSVERQYNLLDVADDFLPQGVLLTSKSTNISLIHDRDDLSKDNFEMIFSDHDGTKISGPHVPLDYTINRVANMTDIPDRFTDPEFSGYRYDLKFEPMVPPESTHGPLLIELTNTEDESLEQILPTYPITGIMKRHILNLKMYLDKARLIEIDPTLQWQTEELAHAVYEGLSYVNAYPSVLTYWTPERSPSPMHTPIWYAAAMYALNARYLAEGFNSFQFSGASTSLDFDRRDAITYKIEELKSHLETNLQKTKSMAIRSFGIGTPPASDAGLQTNTNLGHLGLQASAVNNVRYHHMRRHQFTTRRF